jgi:hypothetical protein
MDSQPRTLSQLMTSGTKTSDSSSSGKERKNLSFLFVSSTGQALQNDAVQKNLYIEKGKEEKSS